jgi:hypothetical protein
VGAIPTAPGAGDDPADLRRLRRGAVCLPGKAVAAAWQEAIHEEKPEPFRCVGCKGRQANICVGFAGYPESPNLHTAVKWFYVGIRCCKCGILRVFNDGKVGRLPAEEVYPEVTGEAEAPGKKPNRSKKSVKKRKRKRD